MAFSEQEIQRTPCNTDIGYIKLPHKGTKEIELTLYDENGVPIDLDSEDDTLSVKFIGKTTVTSTHVQWEVDCELVVPEVPEDPEDPEAPEEPVLPVNKIKFQVTKEDITKQAGLFTANILIFKNDELETSIPYYVEVTTNTLSISEAEPVTISEVRLELRDTCPEANFLIDELEFSDAEIIHCIRKAVDIFNSVPPFVIEYNTSNFPWRSRWLSAASACLLRMAAASYRRNSLRYSAGGVSVDDKNKAEEYEIIAQKILQEFEVWAQSVKISVNINRCYGTVSSAYSRKLNTYYSR